MEKVCNKLFPEDVLREILSRLAAKPLMRFKLVSKYWHFLISPLLKEHYFITKHFHNANTLSPFSSTPFIFQLPGVLLFRDLYEEHNGNGNGYPSVCSNSSCLSLPLFPEDGSTEFLGCYHCNGLLCLVGYHLGITLANPELQEQWSFSMPSDQHHLRNMSFSVKTILFGFSYDSHSDNYKIVQVITRLDVAEVYTISSESTKRVRLPHDAKELWEMSSYAYCNGVCYWMMNSPSKAIISFDFREDVLRVVKLPVCSLITEHRTRMCSVMTWNDWLVLVCYDSPRKQEETGHRWIKMWVLERGFWKEHVFIEKLDGMEVVLPLTFWRGNELFMRDPCKNEFFSYDIVRQDLRFVNTSKARNMEFLTTHLRSLVSLKEICKILPDYYIY